MPDDDRRRLEREAHSGDVEAMARLLVERVRIGQLTKTQLEVAAHLGHPAAVRATSASSPKDSHDVGEYLRGLEPFGGPVVVRGLVALATWLLGSVRMPCEFRGGITAAVAAALAWCSDPTSERAAEARRNADAVSPSWYFQDFEDHGEDAFSVLLVVAGSARAAHLCHDGLAAELAKLVNDVASRARQFGFSSRIQGAMTEDLLRWALS